MNRFLPHVTVAAVVADRDRFLLVEEHDRMNTASTITLFNQPAGHLEAEESLIDAVYRETLEESGWEITLVGYLGLYINTAPNGVVYHSHTFLARPERRVSQILDEGITRADWYSLTDIETLERHGRLRSPLVARRIRDALEDPVYPLDLIRDLNHPT
ncbi:ADP-ribose pyrophosphatase YjhB, NUDIX family [Kushneria avicenniae]|uniref:ADP-ribose pyrophosphatase YjhB, NUDIX family n=1 Tax=Kushneria avicenniae TaxID=402385 RepID=A0A1I1IHP2_9GAMM|nr:NUDIX domain-containing protein [Kushneria avicenniae]SFC35481.1 ADP-ribose pyrophosphatase YjhB, NUDIX family [Kushneria avicenniae]